MNRLIAVIFLSLIPISGCSSPEPELSYDPIELMEYELCLNTPIGELKDNWTPQLAEALCKNKKPTLK